MKRALIGALDQSTTSTKLSIFTQSGSRIAFFDKAHEQITPKVGWIEHNPMEILQNTQEIFKQAKQFLGDEPLSCLGITNQRESTIAWNKHSGIPYYNSIVWNDSRSAEACQSLINETSGANHFKSTNGLLISPYFSAFKIQWLQNHLPELLKNSNEVMYGNIDAWLMYNLTGKAQTDVTNASRTFLFDLNNLTWDPNLLSHFKLTPDNLPSIHPSGHQFGNITSGPFKNTPVTSILGDQQAASLGHGIHQKGQMKTTYGTGCFTQMHIGDEVNTHPDSPLLTSVLYQLSDTDKVQYCLEGSIESGAATFHLLQNQLKLFKNIDELTEITKASNDSTLFMPSSLLCPHWTIPKLSGFLQLGMNHTKDDLVRGGVETVALRNEEVFKCMEQIEKIEKIVCDGGVAQNDYLMGFQAGLRNNNIHISRVQDATGYGVGYLAAKIQGLTKEPWGGQDGGKVYHPDKSQDVDNKWKNWCKVVKQVL